jgi:hypothetical protein
MKAPRHASSAVPAGKAKVIKWAGNNFILEYSDMFVEGRIIMNVARRTQLFLSLYMLMTL